MSVVVRILGWIRLIVGVVLELAERAAAAFSRVADISLNPDSRSGRAAPLHLAGWTLLNTIAFASIALPVSGSYSPPKVVVAAICAAGVLVNLLFVSAALLKLREDNDVLNGLVLESDRRFRTYAAVSSTFVVVNSIVFLVLFLASSLQLADTSFPSTFSAKADHLQYSAYLVATLKALPAAKLVVSAAGHIGVPLIAFEFANIAGEAAEHTVLFISSVLLVGLIALWLKQIRDTDRLIEQYLDAPPSDRHYLQRRIELSPLIIRPRILHAAVTPRAARKQTRAIQAAVKLRILEFPRFFCESFREQRSKSVKRRGLESALQIIEENGGSSYGDQLATDALSAAIDPFGKTYPRSEQNLALSRLVVALMHRTRSLSSLSPKRLSILLERLPDLVARKSQRDNDLQIGALDAVLRHNLTEIVAHFLLGVDRYPRNVALEGIGIIQERLERDFSYSAFAPLILPAIEALERKVSVADDVGVALEQLRQTALARSTPPPSFARRALDWIPGSMLKKPTADLGTVSSKAPSRDAA